MWILAVYQQTIWILAVYQSLLFINVAVCQILAVCEINLCSSSILAVYQSLLCISKSNPILTHWKPSKHSCASVACPFKSRFSIQGCTTGLRYWKHTHTCYFEQAVRWMHLCEHRAVSISTLITKAHQGIASATSSTDVSVQVQKSATDKNNRPVLQGWAWWAYGQAAPAKLPLSPQSSCRLWAVYVCAAAGKRPTHVCIHQSACLCVQIIYSCCQETEHCRCSCNREKQGRTRIKDPTRFKHTRVNPLWQTRPSNV